MLHQVCRRRAGVSVGQTFLPGQNGGSSKLGGCEEPPRLVPKFKPSFSRHIILRDKTDNVARIVEEKKGRSG